MGTKYSIPEFIRDAKAVLASDVALDDKKQAISEHLKVLAQRDDLTRFGLSLGPSDASTHSYLLWREKPYVVLTLASFDAGYLSPVHDHGDFWVVAAGWRGVDRWDMYERQDDGTRPGYADLKMVDQIFLPPGKAIWMPRPPRCIHSHNNTSSGMNMELVFTAATPQSPDQRLVFDVEGKRCWNSPWDMTKRKGDNYPPVPVARTMLLPDVQGAHKSAQPAAQHPGKGLFTFLRPGLFGGQRMGGPGFACPICMALA